MKKWDVYIIINNINSKKYVGITSNGYKKRFLKHINESKHCYKRILCKAIAKYGVENFEIKLIEQVESKELACEKEKYYINFYNTYAYSENSEGYNQTLGGEGTESHRVNEELRMKLKNIRIKEKRWQCENNPNYGKGHLMKGANHFNYGKTHSDATKKKISESNKGRLIGNSNPSVNENVTYVKVLKTGEIFKFKTFYDARKYFEEYKLNRSSLIQVIRGQRKTHKGLIFYRKDETQKEIFELIECEYNNKFKPSTTSENTKVNE